MNAKQRRKQNRSWIRSSVRYLRELRAIKCICGAPIDWYYQPSGIDKRWGNCDACVERGCSCNTIFDEDGFNIGQEQDEQGRPYPCCEFESLRWVAQQHHIAWNLVTK